MTTALVISGGGSKGAFAVGAIDIMRRMNISFDIVVGTSTGALIGPLVAIDDIDELFRIYTSVRTKNIIRGNWRKLYYNARYDTKPLEKLVRKTMAGPRFDQLQMSRTAVYLCAVSLYTDEIKYFSNRLTGAPGPDVIGWGGFNEFVACVLGSTNQPFLMPPSIVRGLPYVDGGVREIAPLSMAYRLGADEVFVIANSPEQIEDSVFPLRIDRIGLRALDMMTTEILNNDLLVTGKDVVVIRPDQVLTDNDLEFVPEKMRSMVELGRRRAAEILG